MFKQTISTADLDRLKLAREDADRLYSDALSELDTVLRMPEVPL